jgi:response regulator RpfG family c-di-GMP phosphodiesterase
MDRILVVDDESLICSTLSGWLREAGYETAEAHSGGDALREVSARLPDLILLDLVMPNLSGLAVCQALKKDDSTARVPVVILTGRGSSEDRIRCLDAGADEFLSKPVEREELVARVRSLLRSKHLSDRLLISYYELDRLGTFAEGFAGQIVADLKAVDVAASLAQQVLGEEPGLPNRPVLTWGGMLMKGRMFGLLFYFAEGQARHAYMDIDPARFQQCLRPFDRGEGQYLCKDPMPPELRELLNVPQGLAVANFVGFATEKFAILAGGYPWEVGSYELPLLRAITKHWNVFERIRYETRQTEKAFAYTMEALALAAEFYDPGTAGHLRRVSAYAGHLGKVMGCDARFVRWLTRCAQMHDVGKITIPIGITRKAGPLSMTERAVMQRHTVHGAQILGASPHLAMARQIALHHHENYDGSGYPEQKRGDQIPLEARIVKVVDIYDALRTPRSYKQPLSHEGALTAMRKGDGRTLPAHFDPKILEAFQDERERILEIYELYTEGAFLEEERRRRAEERADEL